MKSSLFYICRSLLLLVAVISYASTSVADVRLDAESAHFTLHRNPAVNRFPDDLKSLDLVFDIAQRYFMVGEQENADRFYLMALQKAMIIEAMIKASEEQEMKPQVENRQTDTDTDADAPAEEAVSAEPDSKRIIGARGVYKVVKGDTVRLVAAKLGVGQQQLRSMNGLDARAYLMIGQKLVYNNRKIIPLQTQNGIIVNIPDRTLYYFKQGVLVTSLPVALGSVTNNEKHVWQTPVGKFKITGKIINPTWTVPASIQTEMEEQGKEVITTVSPGPENPLGKYAMKTSIPGILIHSTTRPSSIYSFSSHGCIRLSPDQMENFFPQVKVNTLGEIIYKPVKLAVTESGRVFLEVHRDFYNKSFDLVTEARRMVVNRQLSDSVDWAKFKAVVKKKSGIAEDISL